MMKPTTISAAVLTCMLFAAPLAHAQITIDGNLSDWTEDMRVDVLPNRPIFTWHDGVANGTPFYRDNAPANPADLNYMKDLNYKALYASDDEKFLYVRVVMNPLADVRRMFPGTAQYDQAMYPNGGELTLSLSLDPNLLQDFKDESGMTWGWYYNGIDMSVSMWPDAEFKAETGYDAQIVEHAQNGNGWAFAAYSRRTDIGAIIKWNEAYNEVELAIPKSILLQPVNLPNYAVDGHGSYVTMMLRSAHANAVTGNQWWSQTIANNEQIAGYLYTYTTEWNGQDVGEPVRAITIDGDLSDWTEAMRVDVSPNRPIFTWAHGVSTGTPFYRDNAPADPANLEYLKDLNYAALYATDDDMYFYVRADMTPTANVHRAFPGNPAYDQAMYPNGGELTLSLSLDPDLLRDFKDETGMTWGWYYNGIDMSVSLYPNAVFKAETGFDAQVVEHAQNGNGWAFAQYSRRTDIGAKIAWNEAGNKVEIAIPKSILLQPVNLPNYAVDGHGSYVTMMLRSAHANAVTGNQWWSQTIANNEQIAGYLYTYTAEWGGRDPIATSIDNSSRNVPSEFMLEQNYPNPFNPTTQIRFTLDSAQPVVLTVYDVMGRVVSTSNIGMKAAGTHTVTFNATGLSSGVYLYSVSAGIVTRMGKMILAK